MRRSLGALLLVLAGLALVGGLLAASDDESERPIDSQVRQLYASLYQQIVPPAGTPKTEVDRIYGTPEEIREMPHPPNMRFGPRDYPMQVYQLLGPQADTKADAQPRAYLHVTYGGDRVYHSGIVHTREVINRATPMASSPSQHAEMERERRCMLGELLEIYDKFKVTAAAWNTKPQD